MNYQLQDGVAVLSRTPATLDALLRNQPASWLECREAPDTFSPLDVLGHLIYGEIADWIPRARIILEHGESRAFDPFDRRGGEPLIRGRAIGELLDQFAGLRSANLKALDEMRLDASAFALTGTHPELGRVTMGNLLATWVAHDLGHISQIVRVMSRQYREAVGPWRQYLSLMG
jgi:hypothetical protein